MTKPTIDTRTLVAIVILAILALRLTALPSGATWWQAWPFR